MQSNELTLPSDSFSMLAETAINNCHHVPDEESKINHNFENESPSYLQLIRQILPRKSKALDSDTLNESNRSALKTKIHTLRHQLHSFAKVVSNGDLYLAIALLGRVSDSIRNETKIERKNQFLEN